MATKPPGAGVSELVAFALIDGLLRRLVAQQTIMAADAANMIEGIISDVRALNLSTGERAIPVLEEMLREYRKQAR